MPVALWYFVTFAIFSVQWIQSTTAQDESFPDLENLVYASFQSRVEATKILDNITSYVEEYFDMSGDNGRLDLLENGFRASVWYYNENRQSVSINENICKVGDLGDGVDDKCSRTLFYGWKDSKEGVMMGPSVLLRKAFREKSKLEKGNITTVRGIRCLKWTLRDEEDDNEITIEYFFTVPGWMHPFGMESKIFPVRIIVVGTLNCSNEEDNQRNIEEVFDYVYFYPIVLTSRLFQPTAGVGCKGYKNDFTVPKFPKDFRLTAEQYKKGSDDTEESVVVRTLWYDYDNKLIRIDTSSSGRKFSSVLSDYNTGAAYTITGNKMCNFGPLEYQLLEYYNNSLFGEMANANVAFHLTGDVYYLGKERIRGIECDVWETVKENITIGNTEYRTVVYTYYFSSIEWEFVTGGIKNKHVPVRIVIKGYIEAGKVSYTEEFNLFNFKNSIGNDMLSSFNMEMCFPQESQKIYFSMVIPATKDVIQSVILKSAVFNEKLKSVVMEAAQISKLRLSTLRVDFESSAISVFGQMLDRPPYIFAFKEISDGVPPGSNDEVLTGIFSSPESCAKACLDSDRGCNYFFYCLLGETCILGNTSVTENVGEPSTQFTDCTVFFRNELNSKASEPMLNDAIENLKNQVQNKKVEVLWDLNKNKKEKLIANDFKIEFEPYKRDNEITYNEIISATEFDDPEMLETVIEVKWVSSADDCYKKCKEETSISCATFSYCDRSTTCRLSSLLEVKDIKAVTTLGVACNVYRRSYLEFYEKYEGKVFVTKGQADSKAQSELECAQKCQTETKFKCRSFDYCKGSKLCTLRKRHILDVNAGEMKNTAGNCAHYSAKFITDYMDLGHTVLTTDSIVDVYSVTIEECAQLCSEEHDVLCKSFNYCPGSASPDAEPSCSLFSVTLGDDNVDSKSSSPCRHLMKRKGVDDWITDPDGDNTGDGRSKKDNSGYTPGQLAGLIIGMIIFGAVLGVAGFMGYSYYRSKKEGNDGMSVRFTR